jgi:mono/diheme cytochrome c family protein
LFVLICISTPLGWRVRYLRRATKRSPRMCAMANSICKVVSIAAVVVAFAPCTWAQDRDFGKMAYLSSCAECHGDDGKGNGPLAAKLKSKPIDLTTLAKNNGGVFPEQKMYEVIDGRRVVAAHGTREMPAWGDRFLSFGPDTQHIAQNRILAIVDYLKRIQAE